ncbi:MAG: helicase HerA-like domain-containing protein [Lachnospiraceae bacterium]
MKTNDRYHAAWRVPLSKIRGMILAESAEQETQTELLLGLAEELAGRGVPVLLEDPGRELLFRYAGGDGKGRDKEDSAELPGAAIWRAFSGDGIPFRIPVSDLGPELLSRLLALTAPQEMLLASVFSKADAEGLLLDDAADLAAYLVKYGEENRGKSGMADRIRGRIDLLVRAAAGDPFGSPGITPADFFAKDGGMLHFVEGSGSGVCLLWLLAACAETLPLLRPGENPILAVMLTEDTARIAAERMQRDLASRGILLIAGTGIRGPVPAVLQRDSAMRIRWESRDRASLVFTRDGCRQEASIEAILANSAPAPGGLAGVLVRTEVLPEYRRLSQKKEQNSAREALAARAEEQKKEDKTTPASCRSGRERNGALRDVGRSVAGTVGRQIGEDVGRNFGDFGRRLGGNLGASLGRGILSTLLRR